MKTYSIVYDRKGNELSYTPGSPIGEVGKVDVDMGEVSQFLFSSDMWIPVFEKRFYIKNIELPDCIPIDLYLQRQNWIWLNKSYINSKLDPLKPEIFKALFLHYRDGHLSEKKFSAAVGLLTTKKFRNQFRASLRDQITSWCLAENRTYVSPLSHKQWDCILWW